MLFRIRIENPRIGQATHLSVSHAERLRRQGRAEWVNEDHSVLRLTAQRTTAECSHPVRPLGRSLAEQIAEYGLFRDLAYRWQPQPSDGILVVQARGGISQAAINRAIR